MFLFFSDRLGCLGSLPISVSLLISFAPTLVLLALLGAL